MRYGHLFVACNATAVPDLMVIRFELLAQMLKTSWAHKG